MAKRKKRFDWLLWTPRILVIIYILFLSMFAFDVFGEGYGFPEVLIGLFMHLIPSLVLIALLVVAWKWPRWGGIAFLVLGVIFTIFFKTYQDLVVFLLISLPVFVVGGLFLAKSPSS